MDQNKEWMAKGNIGCTFASLFATKPHLCNWVTVTNPDKFIIPEGAMILSLQFPDKDMEYVYQWAINNGFYTEDLGEGCVGLRYNMGYAVSWVQYFGPDSHVKTRQAPIPELCLCVRIPFKYYAKVGFKSVLHLAHASVEHLTNKAANILWNSSFTNTEKKLGHKPGLKEAAKTTYYGKRE